MASHSPSGPTSPLVLRIFLASPGDVAHERVLARRLIREDLAYAHEIAGKAELEVVAWDDPDSDSPMLVTLTPQEAIKRNLRQPADCDVVIAIFWARMGTPLPEDWKKSDGSRFLSGTEWEYLNAIETSMAIGGRPRVYVYRRSEKPTLEQDDPEFDAKREQWKKVESFFASFRAADGSIRASVNPYSTPEDFRRVLRAHLLKVFTELIAERRSNTDEPAPRNVTSPAPPPWQGSPFPGLRAFTPADAPIFFGRGRETDTLVELLADPRKRFVLVAAASGSGKSSLVAAGLLPRLRDNAVAGSRNWLLPWVHPAGDSDRVTWTGLRFTPGELGDDPFVPLAAKLAPLMASDTQPRIVAEQIRIQPAALRAAIDTILHDKPKTVEALVFVDQFEEALTVVAEHYRESFIDMLVDVAKSARVRVIATIRADFHHRAMEAHPRLSETIQQSGALVWLDPPSGYALAEMISAPAARAGLQFDPNLPQHICEEVERSPGALALLAFALHELYEARAGDKLTRIAYDAFGGLKGAISKRAEATFNALPHASQAVLPRVFSELVTADENGVATRKRAPYGDVTSLTEAKALVDAFVEARLLVTDRDPTGASVVEVAHEAMFREWPRLKDWIRDRADDLRLKRQVDAAAFDWARAQQSNSYLWRQDRLDPVYAVLERLGINRATLTEPTRSFIRPEATRLLEELKDISTHHKRRAEIGDRLIELGDQRPGVGLKPDGTPDIVWCDIPAGTVDLEDGKGSFDVKAFAISKYLVTYVQYKSFLHSPDGYRNERWWVGLKHEFKPREKYRPTGNCPAENVSWYDAIAFCRWLSESFGYIVRPPTEWEWQQAATSGRPDYQYPWGVEWQEGFSNTSESHLSRTTAVGMYPHGASSQGVEDLAGNVWEWCLNPHDKPAYDMPTGIGLDRFVRRVVRGGSWGRDQDGAHASYRHHGDPDNRGYSVGFRIVRVFPIRLNL